MGTEQTPKKRNCNENSEKRRKGKGYHFSAAHTSDLVPLVPRGLLVLSCRESPGAPYTCRELSSSSIVLLGLNFPRHWSRDWQRGDIIDDASRTQPRKWTEIIFVHSFHSAGAGGGHGADTWEEELAPSPLGQFSPGPKWPFLCFYKSIRVHGHKEWENLIGRTVQPPPLWSGFYYLYLIRKRKSSVSWIMLAC